MPAPRGSPRRPLRAELQRDQRDPAFPAPRRPVAGRAPGCGSSARPGRPRRGPAAMPRARGPSRRRAKSGCGPFQPAIASLDAPQPRGARAARRVRQSMRLRSRASRAGRPAGRPTLASGPGAAGRARRPVPTACGCSGTEASSAAGSPVPRAPGCRAAPRRPGRRDTRMSSAPTPRGDQARDLSADRLGLAALAAALHEGEAAVGLGPRPPPRTGGDRGGGAALAV